MEESSSPPPPTSCPSPHTSASPGRKVAKRRTNTSPKRGGPIASSNALHDKAFDELEHMLLTQGGGGVSSARSTLSHLIALPKPQRSQRRAPAAFAPEPAPVLGVAVAQYDFAADPRQRGAHRELSFRSGDMLSVLHSKHPMPDGWLIASNACGDVGLVPTSFVQVRMMTAHVMQSLGDAGRVTLSRGLA
jgi:hypothetical protein